MEIKRVPDVGRVPVLLANKDHPISIPISEYLDIIGDTDACGDDSREAALVQNYLVRFFWRDSKAGVPMRDLLRPHIGHDTYAYDPNDGGPAEVYCVTCDKVIGYTFGDIATQRIRAHEGHGAELIADPAAPKTGNIFMQCRKCKSMLVNAHEFEREDKNV